MLLGELNTTNNVEIKMDLKNNNNYKDCKRDKMIHKRTALTLSCARDPLVSGLRVLASNEGRGTMTLKK